jgi:hypothetical protein
MAPRAVAFVSRADGQFYTSLPAGHGGAATNLPTRSTPVRSALVATEVVLTRLVLDLVCHLSLRKRRLRQASYRSFQMKLVDSPHSCPARNALQLSQYRPGARRWPCYLPKTESCGLIRVHHLCVLTLKSDRDTESTGGKAGSSTSISIHVTHPWW